MPARRNSSAVCFGVGFLALVLLSCAPVHAQLVPIGLGRIVDAPMGVVPDGRLHLTVAATLHSGNISVEVESVQWQDGGIDITLLARLPVNGYTQPAISEVLVRLTIDNAPPGSYPLRLRSHILLDETTLIVADQRRTSFPVEARIWPPDPTAFDSVWVLVDLWNKCHELEAVGPHPAWGVLREHARSCDQPVVKPRLAASRWPPHPIAPRRLRLSDGPISFLPLKNEPYKIERRLTPRMNGAWFDPAQPGHGINVEVLDQESMLLKWLTFDAEGEPMWIVAIGPHEGDTATLQALTVSGGRFPPGFDPDLVQQHPWGTISVQFHSCDQATMSWQSEDPGGSAGSMPLERLVGAEGPPCAQPPPESMLDPAWYQGPGTYFRLPDPD